MPEFASPFSGNVDKKMDSAELLAALRLDLASELEAIHLYQAHARTTTDPLAQKVLLDIANEEKEHCGELLALVRRLDPKIDEQLQEGAEEVAKMAATAS
jgi:rubrerythrin